VSVVTETAVPSPYRVFWAVLRRDLYVTGRDLWIFLAQVLLQPLFLLFVFGKVLASIGATQNGYGDLLFPGIVALTAVLTALQATALPLVLDFSFSREIEDRLLAPMPVMWVGVEKIVYAVFRALVATLVIFPLGRWIIGPLPVHADGIVLLLVTIVLGSLLGSALGMTLGTFVPVNRLNILFALVVTPLIFTGCTQYPWPLLASLRWFQVLTLVNPLTYVSEAMRAASITAVPHMSVWVCVPVTVACTVLFLVVGLIGFRRRALD
jgi:ABC-2 type transport system permease protein